MDRMKKIRDLLVTLNSRVIMVPFLELIYEEEDNVEVDGVIEAAVDAPVVDARQKTASGAQKVKDPTNRKLLITAETMTNSDGKGLTRVKVQNFAQNPQLFKLNEEDSFQIWRKTNNKLKT